MFGSLLLAIAFLHGCGEAPSDSNGLEDNVFTEDFNATSKPSRPSSIRLYSPTSSPSNNRTPTFTVSGVKKGNTVYIYRSSSCSGTPLKSGKATSTSIRLKSSTLSTGTHKISARQKNSAGYSSCRGYVTYVLDYTAPAAPVINSPIENGFVNSTPTISGTCEAGSTVYFSDGVQANSTSCTSGGTFSKAVLMTSGDGAKNISVRQKDAAGNYSVFSNRAVTQDSVAPTVTVNQALGQADPTNSAIISFNVVFDEAIDPNSFSALDILNFGSASGVVWDAPSTVDNINWILTTSSIATDGSIIPALGANSVTDLAGNGNMMSSSSDNSVNYDTSVPTVSIGSPSTSSIASGNVDYSVLYSGASSINLTAGSVNVVATGTVTYSVSVLDGTTSSPTIRVNVTGGDGIIDSVSIASGTSQNASGNFDIGASQGANVNIDNTAPTVSIGTPSVNVINTGSVAYNVTYAGASSINLASSDVVVGTSGTVTYTKSVIGGTTSSPTVTVIVTGGDGEITGISINAGTSQDAVGNADIGASQGANVNVDNTAPTISIVSANDIHINNDSNYGFSGTCNEDGASISIISPSGVSGSTTCSSNAFGFSALDFSSVSDGSVTLTVRIQDSYGNFSTDSQSIDKDVLPPSISIGSPSTSSITTGNVDYAVTYTDASIINLTASDVVVNTTGSVTFTKSVSNGTTANPTITVNVTGGDGSINSISINGGTSQDSVGNTDVGASQLISVTVDNTASSVIISSPSVNAITVGAVNYSVNYTDASTINLTASDITVNTTGSVTFTKSVTGGTTSSPTITISVTGGDGTIDSISIAAGTSQDLLGNADVGAVQSTTVTVDNTGPVVSIDTPSASSIGTGSVDYTVTYSDANSINLLAGNVTVNASGTITYTVSISNGTSASPTIHINVTGGDGTIDSISIAAGTSQDALGNMDIGASQGTDVAVDNTGPVVSIDAPSTTAITTGSVNYNVTYSDANSINLLASHVTVNTTGTVTYSKSVNNGTTSNPTIVITVTGGDGSIDSISIAAGTSQDAINNSDGGASEGTDVAVDNTAPVVSIGTPSVPDISTGAVNYDVSYSGASSINLTGNDVIVNTTGTVTYSKSVNNGTTANPTIVITVTGGDGSIDSVSIAAGTSQDSFGNADAGASQGTDVTVDNTPSSVSIGAPSVSLINTGAVNYAVTYTDASSINLSASNVSVTTTGTVTYSKSVNNGTTANPTIVITITGGDGTIDSVSIAAGTSQDAVGNADTGASQGTDVIVDNTPSSVSIGAPSVSSINTGTVNYAVTYSGASTINLTAANVSVSTSGSVTFSKSVNNGTTANPTIVITVTGGDGSIDSISIAAGTSQDAVGNSDVGDTQLIPVAVDNTAPTVSIGVPSVTDINTGAVNYAVSYSGTSTINLLASDITVNTTGTVTFSKSVNNGTTANPTIVITITGGDGTIDSISIATGTSQDAVGNADTGASQGTDVTVDNTGPVVVVGAPSVPAINTGTVNYAVTYTGASSINLTAGDVTVNTTGTVAFSKSITGGTTSSPTIVITVTGGDGSIDSISIAAGTSQDTLNNPDTGASQALAVTVDNTPSSVSIGAPSVTDINTGAVNYDVTYTDASLINLSASNVTVNTTGSVAYSKSVNNGTTANPTIIITITGGDGTIDSISIGAGTSQDAIGNADTGASQGADVTVDNTPPAVSIGTPSVSAINTGAVDYAVTYSGASTINLSASNVSVTTTGTVTYSKSVTNGTTSTPTVTITITGGDGTIDSISIGAGTSQDAIGNADTGASQGVDVTVDNTAPTVTITTPMSDIKVSNVSAYSFSGTCNENGATITITAPSAVNGTTTTCSSSTFTFSNLNMSSVPNGIVNFTVQIQDALNNASSDTKSATKDSTAPSISSLALSSPATSPGNDSTPTIQINGTFTVGDDFQLFTDMTCTSSISSVVAASGTSSVLVTTNTLSPDGSYTFFAKGTDSVGNVTCDGIDSVSYTLDTAPPTIANGTLSIINNANKASYSFSGTCTANGDSINLTAPVSASTTCSSGTFSFSGLNLTSVPDGSVTFTVGISDTASNTASDSDSITKDTVNPSVTNGTLLYITPSNQASYSFSGTCADGTTVSLTSPISTSTTCSSGTFSFTNLNLSALGEGNATFTTSITDSAGNTATDNDVGAKDTVAPTTPTCVSVGTDGVPSKSNTQTWTGSTDATSGINYYEMSLGISSAADTVGWTTIGSTVAPYQFTGISPELLYETLYRAYIRVRDNAGNISSVATCSQWELKRGYGVFKGTQTTNSTTLNQATAYALQYSASSFNSQYFSHSTSTNSQNITIQYAGNYLLSSNIPVYRTGTAASSGALIANIKINGTAVSRGISANSVTIGGTTTPRGSANHITVLLENLAVNDVITIETANNALSTNAMTVPSGKQFSTVLEYIPNEAEIFTATGSTVVGGSTNLNPASSTKILWTESIKDSTYTHSNSTNPENITIATAGNYLVSVNVPVSGAVTRAKPTTTIFVGGSSATANNGVTTIDASAFISNNSSHITSSANYTNIIYGVTAGQVLDVRQIATTAGTLTVPSGKVASIYIQKLDTSSDYYIGNGGAPANWNASTATNITWTTDKQIDSSIFTHSTSTNPQNITVTSAGDYMLYFSDYITSNTSYVNPIVYVLINGVATPVGVCKAHHNYTTAALRPMSCNLQTMLTLSANDVVSMTTILDVVTGSATNSSVPRLTLRKISN